jgi:hypothetical protein
MGLAILLNKTTQVSQLQNSRALEAGDKNNQFIEKIDLSLSSAY